MHEGITLFSGERAAMLLPDEKLAQCIRRLTDEIVDATWTTFLPVSGRCIGEVYPELVQERPALEAYIEALPQEIRGKIRQRIDTALRSGFVPWTWQHAFALTLQEAKYLRDAGQYTVATTSDEVLVGSLAYKHEGALPDGTPIYSPTKACVFDPYSGRGYYSLIRDEIFRQMDERCGQHRILMLSKNPRVLKHCRSILRGQRLTLTQHQTLRELGDHIPYPECICELCNLCGWEVWLAENPEGRKS
jgi:hypothetical protein